MHFSSYRVDALESFLLAFFSIVCKELYEGPGGNLVDGLPPAPVPRRALRQEELRGIRVQGGASWSTRPEKKM